MRALLAILVLATIRPLNAQTIVNTLYDNQRVRLTASAFPDQLVGNVVTTRPGTLTVVTPGADATVRVEPAVLQKIEVSSGHHRVTAGLIGAAAGFLIGGYLGAHSSNNDPEGWGQGLAAAGGSMAGTIVGAIAGAAYAPEHWRVVKRQEKRIGESAPVTGGTVTDSIVVSIRNGAKVRVSTDAGGVRTVKVRGDRNRQAGMLRGAAVLGGIGVVFGGIDLGRNKIGSAEFASTVFGNAVTGGLIGYFIAPRKWQRLPY